jgi:HD-like signal output (HDOD) protein
LSRYLSPFTGERTEVSSFIEGLQAFLKSGTQLPTLPTVVFQVHAILDDDRKGAADVAAVIERDPALTTRLLRSANSAFYGAAGHQVASVHPAIQRIGMGQVRSLCLVLGVVQAFGSKRRVLSHDALWAHSASVGAVARKLWTATGQAGPLSADDVYVAGLLHDVGLLVLDQFFAAEFDRLAELRQGMELPLWQHEEDLLGMCHGEIGGLFLGCWKLPAAVADAVAFHHKPQEAPEAHQSVCRVVHAAEIACTSLGWGLADEQPTGVEPPEAIAALGVPADRVAPLLEQVAAVAERASGVLV